MRFRQIHSGHVLGAAALLAPPLGVFASNIIAFLAMITILALLAVRKIGRGDFLHFDQPLVLTVGFVLLWSAVTLIWSINPGEATRKWAIIFATAMPALAAFATARRLSAPERRFVEQGVLYGIALGAVLVFFEAATGGAISRLVFGEKSFTLALFNRTPSVLLVFVWPAVAVLWRRSRGAAGVALALGLGLGWMLTSASALGGFALGVAVFAAVLAAPRRAGIVIAAVMVVGVLLAPVLSRNFLDPAVARAAIPNINASLLHRLQIWDFTSKRIAERPILGWGFDSARAIPGGNERYLVRDRDGRVIGQGDRLPLHPHNGALQIWLELGLPGALGFAALLALAAYRAGRLPDRGDRAATLALIATAVPIWLFSFGVWQGWWLGDLMLAALLMVALTAPVAP